MEKIQRYKINLNRVLDFVDIRAVHQVRRLMAGTLLTDGDLGRMEKSVDRYIESQGEKNLLSKRDNRTRDYVSRINNAINNYKYRTA